MRVWITGVKGFLGANLARWLVGRGHFVGGCDLPVPETEAWAWDALNPDLSSGETVGYTVVADVRRHDEVLSAVTAFEPDIVVHLAAASTVQVAQENPRRAWNTNVLGTVNVLEVCRERNLPVVVASSDKAYGAGTPPFREDHPLAPRYPYDVSKACQDLIAQAYARTYGMCVVVTRSCNVYGPADLHWDRLVPGIFRAVATGQPVRVHAGMGDVRREWIHVDDVCRVYEWFIDHAPASSLLNIGSGDVLSRDDLVQRALRAAESTAPVEDLPEVRVPLELGDEWLDHSNLSVLGWAPEVPIDAGLKRTWDWYKTYFEKGGK